MTDRDKLVELFECYFGIDPMYHGIETAHLVDYMIENGVTVKEPQKPLTVEEIKTKIVCWYEERNDAPRPVEIGRITSFIELYIIGGDCPVEEKKWNYGKLWRCWAEKPTETERKNAKWEE